MRFPASALLATVAIAELTAQAPTRREGGPAAAEAWQRHAVRSHATLNALHRADGADLPPPPAGVTDLQFAEFFGPVGDRGLEYSARLRALDGQLVRIVGFMVREQEHTPGLFLLAAWPTAVQTKGPCAYDDAPANAVHVFLPGPQPRAVPYRPGRLTLIGRLALGPRPEADGRNSAVRLFLEPESAALFTPATAAVPAAPP